MGGGFFLFFDEVVDEGSSGIFYFREEVFLEEKIIELKEEVVELKAEIRKQPKIRQVTRIKLNSVSKSLLDLEKDLTRLRKRAKLRKEDNEILWLI